MEIEEIRGRHHMGGIAKCDYDAKRIDWLISEHDRLTAELRAADRGQENLTARLSDLQVANAKMREALEKYGRHEFPCNTQYGRNSKMCVCGLESAKEVKSV